MMTPKACSLEVPEASKMTVLPSVLVKLTRSWFTVCNKSLM